MVGGEKVMNIIPCKLSRWIDYIGREPTGSLQAVFVRDGGNEIPIYLKAIMKLDGRSYCVVAR